VSASAICLKPMLLSNENLYMREITVGKPLFKPVDSKDDPDKRSIRMLSFTDQDFDDIILGNIIHWKS
jgi:hypothetical protein